MLSLYSQDRKPALEVWSALLRTHFSDYNVVRNNKNIITSITKLLAREEDGDSHLADTPTHVTWSLLVNNTVRNLDSRGKQTDWKKDKKMKLNLTLQTAWFSPKAAISWGEDEGDGVFHIVLGRRDYLCVSYTLTAVTGCLPRTQSQYCPGCNIYLPRVLHNYLKGWQSATITLSPPRSAHREWYSFPFFCDEHTLLHQLVMSTFKGTCGTKFTDYQRYRGCYVWRPWRESCDTITSFGSFYTSVRNAAPELPVWATRTSIPWWREEIIYAHFTNYMSLLPTAPLHKTFYSLMFISVHISDARVNEISSLHP